MNQQQDYIRDISEIRSMMERSSKFLSLSGWAGIMAGIYALAGAYIAHTFLNFKPAYIIKSYLWVREEYEPVLLQLFLLCLIIVVMAIGTAFYLSYRKTLRSGEKLWNTTSRRLLINMFVPLVAGGIFILILINKGGSIGLVAPLMLIFYGLSLYIASKFTYDDIKILGLINIILGLIATYYIEYGLLLWALGFGAGHIIYGIYVHFKYDR